MSRSEPKLPARGLAIAAAVVIALATLTTPVAAGTPQNAKSATPPERALDHYVATIREQLTLSQDQEKAVRPIFKKYLEKRMALRKQLRTQDPQVRHRLRKQMRDLQTAEDLELQRVLTPKQMEKLTAFRAERRKEMRQHRRRRGATASQQR